MKCSAPRTNPHQASRLLLAAALLGAACQASVLHAQEIIWSNPVNITGDTDVATNGTPVYAYDYAGVNETVNGITFAGANSANAGGNVLTTLPTYNQSAYTNAASPFGALSAAYRGMLVGSAYSLTTSPFSVTLGNLASGHAYRVQVWANDPRGSGNGRAVQLSSVGGNQVVLQNSTGTGTTGGYPGQFAVGQFTNYSGSQTFTLQTASTGSATPDASMNALQVLDLGPVQTPNVGYWNGLGGGTLGYSTLDFCTNATPAPLGAAASLTTVAGLKSPLFFGDVFADNGNLIPVTVTNLTVAAGGIANGAINFVNTNNNYVLNSSDASGITGATTVNFLGAGTVTLAGQNTYSGGTLISQGTLQVGTGGTTGSLGSGPVVNYGSLVFNRSDNPVFTNLISGGGAIIQAGSGTLTLSNSLNGGPSQTLYQTGAGALILTGSNNYGGSLTIGQGTVSINGAGNGGNPYGSLYVGGSTGIATVNFNTTGTWAIGTLTSGIFYVGGTGSSSDTSAGAFNQTAGNVNFSAGNYFTLAAGGPACYGSYTQSGGTFTVLNTEGVRIGEGGLGSFVQTGGTFYSPRYFVVGGNNTAAGSINNGVATFLGGSTAMSSSYYLIIGNLNPSYGVINLGTEAGGNGSFTAPSGTGPQVGQVSGAVGVLNLNRGLLVINGAIATASGGNGTLNLNGGTIQAGVNNTLINPTVTSVNVYNGGVTVNDQAFNNLISASMLGTSGNGIYPAGGIIPLTSGGGSGYIGAPLVTVTGGSGASALAIATVSNGVIANVTLTCPGQNYLAGDTVSFAFAGGGATNPAPTFNYTLQAKDLAANALGGLTKIGSGTLTLSNLNTYTGSTIVGAGAVNAVMDGALGLGNVVVANGAVLTLTNGVLNAYMATNANLALNFTATANLKYTGNMTINGLSTNGGLQYLPPGVYGSAASGAPNALPQLTGAGWLTVTATPVVTGVQVTLAASPNPVVAGQSVTFTATVAGTGATPSGTVTFLNGTTVLGSAALNNAGMAVFTTNFNAAATDLITANYSGNGVYSSATTLFAVSELVTPRLDFWTGAKSGVWDISTTTNWSTLSTAAVYHDTDLVQFDDTALSNNAVNLNVTVNPNNVIFSNNAKTYTLGGTGAISGAAGVTLSGTGAVTISTTNNYTGNTVVSNGVLTFTGKGSSTGAGVLNVGNGNGLGVLNMNSTGALNFNGYVSVGGISGDTTDTGSGAINQTSGTNNFGYTSSGIYMELGTGGTNAYGYYGLSGGTFNTLSSSGVRIGCEGLGNFLQTGGTLNLSRYLAIGSLSGGVNIGGNGVATMTGGTGVITGGYRVILGDRPGAIAVLNIGTEAGGSNTFNPNSINLLSDAATTLAVLNLNAGTLQIPGKIYRNLASSSSDAVNCNGGTLQAAADQAGLLDASLDNVVIYNGGVIFDTLGYTATIGTAVTSAAGNGLYPAGGTLKVSTGGGSNYIGAPLVTVTGGSGTGATAIATVVNGVVTNVVLTCPGQNYLAGDVVSFDFAGGGTATPAATFNYTLQPADVAANGTGTVTKLGAGTLIQSGSCNYTGLTLVKNGTLQNDGTLGTGSGAVIVSGGTLDGSGTISDPVTVQTNGTLAIGDVSAIATLNLSSTLTLAGTASFKLDKTGGTLSSDLAQGMTSVNYDGTLLVTNLTSDGTALALGDSFVLFNATAYSGSFTKTMLPPLPAGLAWTTAYLTVDGSLRVTNAPPATVSVLTSIKVSGNILTLTATNGTPGAPFVLLGSTNLNTPFAQWLPVLTNTFDANGNAKVSGSLVNPTNRAAFYRLAQ